MNKIKHFDQLKLEKQNLQLQQELLEVRIQNNWNELKYSLKPKVFIKDTFKEFIDHRLEKNSYDESLWKTVLQYGLNAASKKFTGKIGNRILNFFEK